MNPLKIILSLSVVLAAQAATANSIKKQIKVAVIDTGISDDLIGASFLCKEGHKDFTNTGLTDHHGHGTHISGLIDQYAKGVMLSNSNSIKGLLSTRANYCQIIIKFYDPALKDSGASLLHTELLAFRHAIDMGVDIINYSAGGTDYSEEEEKIVKEALQKGIAVVVAAGNEKSNLDNCKRDIMVKPSLTKAYIEYKGTCYFPAVLDTRLTVVGNLKSKEEIAPSSDTGSIINAWEIGTNQLSLAGADSLTKMTGTSQSCAKKTGKLVYKMLAK